MNVAFNSHILAFVDRRGVGTHWKTRWKRQETGIIYETETTADMSV